MFYGISPFCKGRWYVSSTFFKSFWKYVVFSRLTSLSERNHVGGIQMHLRVGLKISRGLNSLALI